ncbi:MAG: asparagine synthase (glutamine-hydrolyzing) [Gemmatimonadota bacterium]
MCGIAGYWNYRSGRPASRVAIDAMTATLSHRGPDGLGTHLDRDLALGQSRLVVVDPEGGRQPMGNEDGSVQVVFNGEIYNHDAIRRELEGRGHRFRTRSDTEAIVHAWEEWGERCVERFNGMFAIAVWDAGERSLFLARDRIGIKPLYLFDGPEGVVFGSELKAVVTAPQVPLAWNTEALDDFITYEYVPGVRSIVAGVEKLLPGTSVTFRADRPPARRRFWTLESRGRVPGTPEEAAETLRDLLRQSVERRLMADVPLGAFLSGGIDSSIIVGLMAGLREDPIRSFSLGFDNASYNELPHARVVAQRFGTLHREGMATPSVVEMAERLARIVDEPFGDVSTFPTYLVSQLARKDVTVALSGDGGDELFAGYDHYRAHRWAHRLRWLTRGWGWQAADALLDRVPPSRSKKGPVNLAKRFAEGLRRPADLEHARWWVFSDLTERRRLYSGSLHSEVADRDPFGHYRDRMRAGSGAGFEGLQRQLYADVTGYLPDDILVKVDRMSMAVSLEARVPFLDHEFVEYAMSIPAEWKLDGTESKRILRSAFRDLLPPQILERGKEGFSMPMKNWIREPLRPMMLELLSPERIGERGWFSHDRIGTLIREHLDGRRNHAHVLWCLMNLELSVEGLEDRVRGRPSLEDAVRTGGGGRP